MDDLLKKLIVSWGKLGLQLHWGLALEKMDFETFRRDLTNLCSLVKDTEENVPKKVLCYLFEIVPAMMRESEQYSTDTQEILYEEINFAEQAIEYAFLSGYNSLVIPDEEWKQMEQEILDF